MRSAMERDNILEFEVMEELDPVAGVKLLQTTGHVRRAKPVLL
jgi:hypothetical protein